MYSSVAAGSQLAPPLRSQTPHLPEQMAELNDCLFSSADGVSTAARSYRHRNLIRGLLRIGTAQEEKTVETVVSMFFVFGC